MKKCEKEEQLVQLILNRVRFHAPNFCDGGIDKSVLFKAGIDPNLPIFKFEKTLTKPLFDAFCKAAELENFNLVVPISCVSRIPAKKLAKLKNLVLFSPECCALSLFEMINKLNINYASSSNFNAAFSEKFFKVNGEVVNAKFDDFSLSKTMNFGEISVDFREFVLNGSNIFVQIQNHSNAAGCVEIELNIPLERGYYRFRKGAKSVRIENLRTGEIRHLNFNAKSAKFRFSQVDGLENSTFSCVNLRAKINVKKREFLFFNFGDEAFSFKNERSVCAFFALSKQRAREIFDVRVCSKNPKFDKFFNVTLPQKIWLGWLDGKENLGLEEKYLALKKLFVKSGKCLNFQRFRELGVREIGVFNGEYYKKILVVSGVEKFLKVGRTFFYNTTSISKNSLKTKEPVSICFGEK